MTLIKVSESSGHRTRRVVMWPAHVTCRHWPYHYLHFVIISLSAGLKTSCAVHKTRSAVQHGAITSPCDIYSSGRLYNKRPIFITIIIFCLGEWILLYVAFCAIMGLCPTLIERVLYSAHYHRQHCTLQAFEQFGALFLLEEKYINTAVTWAYYKVFWLQDSTGLSIHSWRHSHEL